MELKVPPAGESISTVMISEWLVAEGDAVSEDQIVVVLETDKINVEVPSPINGTLEKILKRPGQEADIGEVIAQLSKGSGAGAAAARGGPSNQPRPEPPPAREAGRKSDHDSQQSPEALPGKEATPSRDAAKDISSTPSPVKQEPPIVSPAARRILEENRVDAASVQGTGKDGRIMKEDAIAHVESGAGSAARLAVAPASSAAPPESGREEVVPMSPLRRKIAERLVAAQQTAAILTTFNEVDMSGVMALRQRYGKDFLARHGVKLGFMSFFVKASVEALKAFPAVNAEIRENAIVYKNHYDIGVAVGGGKGLVVPVLRDADRLSFAEVEIGIKELARKAQDMKLSLADLEGGTFTISNGGVYGSMLSTPILNPPQSGILGLHNIIDRPMAVDGKVEIRPIMYLALSYDHRIIDGKGAVSFLLAVKNAIEDPARLLLEI
jgi:2-oxoglutarate dehydrogenase E2 component (dihydrolipoamide succinyltransferase)